MTFEEARAQFPVLERYAYLNAGTFGPMPAAVADAIAAEQQRALGRAVSTAPPSTSTSRTGPGCARGTRS